MLDEGTQSDLGGWVSSFKHVSGPKTFCEARSDMLHSPGGAFCCTHSLRRPCCISRACQVKCRHLSPYSASLSLPSRRAGTPVFAVFRQWRLDSGSYPEMAEVVVSAWEQLNQQGAAAGRSEWPRPSLMHSNLSDVRHVEEVAQ